MAQQFYQKKVQGQTVNQNPVAGPDLSQAYRAVDIKKQQMTNAIEGLLAAGKGAVAVYDEKVTKPKIEEEKAKGSQLANQASAYRKQVNDPNLSQEERDAAQKNLDAVETQGQEFSWFAGNARRDAFDGVAAENAVMSMPDAYEADRQEKAQAAMNDPESKFKSLEDMTPEERRLDYINFKSKYFKDAGIDGKPFSAKASLAADEVMNKHLGLLDRKAAAIRDQKAKNAVAINSATVIDAFSNDPAKADEVIASKMGVWSVAAGGQAQANEAIVNGLMRAASGLENPDGIPNENALAYLNSDQARQRFGGMEGFDSAIKQAKVNSNKFIENRKRQAHAILVQDFHSNLMSNSFQSEKEVHDYFDTGVGKNFEAKEAFTLRNKALKYVKSQQAAINLDEAFALKRTGEINAQPPEVRDQLFGIKVGVFGKDMSVDNMRPEQLRGTVDWIKSGFTPPEVVVKFATSYPNYESTEDRQVMAKQADMYRFMSATMGDQVHKVFTDTKVIGRLNLFNTLEGSTTMTDAEKIKAMQNYEAKLVPGSAAHEFEKQVNIELKADEKMSKKIMSFAKSGTDTQPFLNFSNNDSAPYASNRIKQSYKAYRASGFSSDEAFKRASADFDMSHEWIEWEDGSNTYLPNRLGFKNTDELGYSLENQVKNYLQTQDVLADFALSTGDTMEDVRKNITVRPEIGDAGDTLAVYYKGAYTNVKFTPEQLNGSDASSIYDKQKREEIKNKMSMIYTDADKQEKLKKALNLKRMFRP